MAGEETGYLISIEVDAARVDPGLQNVEGLVRRSRQTVNTELAKFGDVATFKGVIEGADLAELKLRQLLQTAEQSRAAIAALDNTKGLPIASIGGLDRSRLAKLQADAEAQLRVSALDFGKTVGGPVLLGANLIKADPALANDVEGLKAGITGLGYSAREAQSAVSALADQGMVDLNAKATATETRIRALNDTILSNRATSATGAAGGADSSTNQALVEQTGLLERIATIRASLVGLTDKEASAELGVQLAAARVQEALTKQNVSESQILGLVRGIEAAQARQDALQAAGNSGGFFGGFGRGLGSGGFGGSGGSSLEDAGFQAGSIAKYIAAYQVFREIETVIKDSVVNTLEFERNVTVLQTALGGSRDNARELASNMTAAAAAVGVNGTDALQFGTFFARRFQGQAPGDQLAQTGAQIGSQLQIVTGKGAEGLSDATSVLASFNLGWQDTARVIDAATTAAQNYGFTNANDVLPGLAQIADLGSQAGLSLEQTANLVSAVQARTNDSSAAAAGELQRVLGRQGNPAFQAVFAKEGVDTTQSFASELDQLSKKFSSLSDQEKAFITGQFGGGRAGAAALVLLEDFSKITDNANKSLQNAGATQKQFFAQVGDVKGQVHVLGAEFQNLTKDIGESGIGAIFGVALEAAVPLLKAADDLLRAFDLIPSPIRESAFLLGEIYGIVKLIEKVNIGGTVAKALGRGKGADAAAAGVEGAAVGGGAIAAAEAEAAGGIKAAGAGVAEEIGYAGSEGALALRAAAEEAAAAIAGGGVIIADSEAEAGLLAKIGASKTGSAIGGFFSQDVGKVGLAAGAVATGVLVDQEVNAVLKQRAAEGKADGLNISGSTSSELKDAASQLSNAAVATRQSSAGFFGSIENGISSFFGSGSTGASAARDEKLAALAVSEANQLDAASKKVATTGDISGTIALSGQTAITDSIKNLTAQGFSAGQVLDALNERLANFADAAAGGADVLAKGQSQLIAAQLGVGITNNLKQGATIDIAAFDPFDPNGEVTRATKSAAIKFSKLDGQGVSNSLESTANSFFQSQGLDQGGAVTNDQVKALGGKLKDSLTTYLRGNGFSAKDVQGFNNDINLAVLSTVRSKVADANALAGGVLDQDQIGQVLQDLPNLVQGKALEASQAAALGHGAPGVSSTSAGAQAALAGAQATLTALQRSKAPGANIKAVQDLVDGLTIQVQDALVADLQAQGALATSLISPFDKSGRIASQLQILQFELASATDPGVQAQIQTQINNKIAEQSQQTVADANAAAEAQAGIDQTVGKATADATSAKNTLDEIVKANGSQGQDYYNALAANNAALITVTQAQVAQANAIAAANVDSRDTVDTTKAALAAANATLGSTPELDTNGNETVAHAQARAAVAAAAIAVSQQQVALANAARDAGERPGNSLSAAQGALQDAATALSADLPGSVQYYKDLQAWKNAAYALAQETLAQQKITDQLHSDITNPVTQARNAAQEARNKLASDQARGTGNIQEDQLSVIQTGLAAQKALFDQQLSDQQTAVGLRQETEASYLAFLTGQDASLRRQLAGMKKGSQGYRQAFDELNQIDQAILATNQQVQGQFNLGSIKVPTVYEVRRQIAASAAGQAYDGSSTSYITFHINGADTGAVKKVITDVLGPQATKARSVTTRKG